MSNCMVVSVATTEYYQRGLDRLIGAFERDEHAAIAYVRELPPEWPSHQEKPYAFKAYAMMEAAQHRGADLVLWADACILPVQDTHDLWKQIERDGYWMSRNGYSNYEWTADSAYPDLFTPDTLPLIEGTTEEDRMRDARIINRDIPHVVATAFGLNLRSEIGAAFLKEYFRLASETKAFCGPWVNTAWPGPGTEPITNACGPSDVRGHRHDQTAASVIAWRLGMKLTDPPEVFSYPPAGWNAERPREGLDQRTILLADGSYQ